MFRDTSPSAVWNYPRFLDVLGVVLCIVALAYLLWDPHLATALLQRWGQESWRIPAGIADAAAPVLRYSLAILLLAVGLVAVSKGYSIHGRRWVLVSGVVGTTLVLWSAFQALPRYEGMSLDYPVTLAATLLLLITHIGNRRELEKFRRFPRGKHDRVLVAD